MTVNLPPTPGEDVQILAPHRAPLLGHVIRREHDALTVALEPAAVSRPRVAAGSAVSVEWVHELGVIQVYALVADSVEIPEPVIELELLSVAEPAERREHERFAVELDVSVWTLAQPTAMLAGKTVGLSVGGALLQLPGLPGAAESLELTIAFAGGPLHTTAEVRWRRDGLVGVEFQHVSPDDQIRLIEFLRQQHSARATRRRS